MRHILTLYMNLLIVSHPARSLLWAFPLLHLTLLTAPRPHNSARV